MITKQILEDIYAKYHHPKYLKIDPLLCVHRFKDKGSEALEIVGMISSVLAYGRVEIIVRSIDKLIDGMMGGDPVAFVNETSYKEKLTALSGFKHRFNDGVDIATLLETVKLTVRGYGSLERYFCDCLAALSGGGVGRAVGDGGGDDHKNADQSLHKRDVGQSLRNSAIKGSQLGGALTLFTDALRTAGRKLCGTRPSFEYLLPEPSLGSACKRTLLYLRWMVRKDDGIDLGVWRGVPASILLVPVDTHVARIARGYGLTQRNSADWKMAEEITAALREFDADDPVRYDFAICHAGMVDLRG